MDSAQDCWRAKAPEIHINLQRSFEAIPFSRPAPTNPSESVRLHSEEWTTHSDARKSLEQRTLQIGRSPSDLLSLSNSAAQDINRSIGESVAAAQVTEECPCGPACLGLCAKLQFPCARCNSEASRPLKTTSCSGRMTPISAKNQSHHFGNCNWDRARGSRADQGTSYPMVPVPKSAHDDELSNSKESSEFDALAALSTLEDDECPCGSTCIGLCTKRSKPCRICGPGAFASDPGADDTCPCGIECQGICLDRPQPCPTCTRTTSDSNIRSTTEDTTCAMTVPFGSSSDSSTEQSKLSSFASGCNEIASRRMIRDSRAHVCTQFHHSKGPLVPDSMEGRATLMRHRETSVPVATRAIAPGNTFSITPTILHKLGMLQTQSFLTTIPATAGHAVPAVGGTVMSGSSVHRKRKKCNLDKCNDIECVQCSKKAVVDATLSSDKPRTVINDVDDGRGNDPILIDDVECPDWLTVSTVCDTSLNNLVDRLRENGMGTRDIEKVKTIRKRLKNRRQVVRYAAKRKQGTHALVAEVQELRSTAARMHEYQNLLGARCGNLAHAVSLALQLIPAEQCATESGQQLLALLEQLQ